MVCREKEDKRRPAEEKPEATPAEDEEEEEEDDIAAIRKAAGVRCVHNMDAWCACMSSGQSRWPSLPIAPVVVPGCHLAVCVALT